MTISVHYSWRLPSGDATLARQIVEQLRARAVEMRLEPVGDLVALAGDEAEQDERLPRRYVWTPGGVDQRLRPAEVFFFMATFPGRLYASFGLARYQPIAGVTTDTGWSWASVAQVSELRGIGQFMAAAAELGVDVVQSFGGMLFRSKKDESGEVQSEQRWAFDPETF